MTLDWQQIDAFLQVLGYVCMALTLPFVLYLRTSFVSKSRFEALGHRPPRPREEGRSAAQDRQGLLHLSGPGA
jgi:hypothetical protein